MSGGVKLAIMRNMATSSSEPHLSSITSLPPSPSLSALHVPPLTCPEGRWGGGGYTLLAIPKCHVSRMFEGGSLQR